MSARVRKPQAHADNDMNNPKYDQELKSAHEMTLNSGTENDIKDQSKLSPPRTNAASSSAQITPGLTNIHSRRGTAAASKGPSTHDASDSSLFHGNQAPEQSLYRASSCGCSWSMVAFLLLSMSLLATILHSSFNLQMDTKGCLMTYMHPEFYRLMGLDRQKSVLAGKYGLLLYKGEYDYKLAIDPDQLTRVGDFEWQVDKVAKVRPHGIPVLFVPGNAGSAKQVRSIANEASKYYESVQRPGSKPIDFFTVDLNEEFSALHGNSLLEQAQYVNDAIAFVLTLYADDSSSVQSAPRPASVIVIGHSMGGIVARTIFTMENYRSGSVNTILTIATPHLVPPVTLDSEIGNVYDRVESFWTAGFNGTDAPLRDVSLVSILGGNLDITVNSDSGNIHNIIPLSHGFAVFSTSIPHVWVGSDHVSILWCNQLVSAIGKTLVDIVDPTSAGMVSRLGKRMSIFRDRFLTGANTHLQEASHSSGEERIILSEQAHTLLQAANHWEYPPATAGQRQGTPHLYLVPAKEAAHDTLSILTDHTLDTSSRLEVLLCRTVSGGTVLLCKANVLTALPVPASTTSSSMPLFSGEYFTGREFRSISQDLRDLRTMVEVDFVVIRDKGGYSDPGFLVIELSSIAETTVRAEISTLGIIQSGLQLEKIPSQPSLVSVLKLPNVDNSLLSYRLFVKRDGCLAHSQRFAPMMLQSSRSMYEGKYSVNIVGKAQGVEINFHSDTPYNEKITLPGKEGIDLRFWSDPTCPVPLSVDLQVDVRGSLGKVVTRYRMVVLVFTFMVIMIALRAQFQVWNQGGRFQPFGTTLTRLILSTFPKFSVFLAVIAVVQYAQVRATVALDDQLQDAVNSGLTADAGKDAYQKMIEDRSLSRMSLLSRFRLENMLLGANDPLFWFLAPVFFQISVGIVVLVWVLFHSLVVAITKIVSTVLRARGQMFSPRSRSILTRVTILTAVFMAVATFVPHQFAFLVAVVVHIGTCVRALLEAQTLSEGRSDAAWDRYHFVMSMLVMFIFLLPFSAPIIMVYVRNLFVHWYKPVAADHRVVYVAPFILLIELMANGFMVPRAANARTSTYTILILDGILLFLIVDGVRNNWQIFSMARIWVAWLALLHFRDVNMAQSLAQAIETSAFGPRPKQQTLSSTSAGQQKQD